jgi:hypothetical protein
MYAPDAHGFEVYFLNTDVNGCVAYDSNHGRTSRCAGDAWLDAT